MKLIAEILILTGALIMLVSIIKYAKLFKFPLNLKNDKHSKLSMMIRINFIMMFFFFIGYLITTVMLIENVEISTLLIGLIFFFGAVFVFSVIFIQFELSEVINEIYSFSTVEALVNTIEAKDVYTQGHSKHVASLSVCLYDHLPRQDKKTINKHMLRYAGFLHDIGKIGVSDTIINKVGVLTDEEREEMKKHPQIGKDIISSNVMLSSIGDWILYHHERIDGSGYHGLKDEEIPLEAKIISVADTYSALTTDRSYHKGKDHTRALEIMQEVAGSQLDKTLIDVFSKISVKELKKCVPQEMNR